MTLRTDRFTELRCLRREAVEAIYYADRPSSFRIGLPPKYRAITVIYLIATVGKALWDSLWHSNLEQEIRLTPLVRVLKGHIQIKAFLLSVEKPFSARSPSPSAGGVPSDVTSLPTLYYRK